MCQSFTKGNLWVSNLFPNIIRLQMRTGGKKCIFFYFCVLWCLLLSLTCLSAESNWSQRSAPTYTLTSWQGHFLPVPKSTRNSVASPLFYVKLPHRIGKYTLKSVKNSMVCFINPSLFWLWKVKLHLVIVFPIPILLFIQHLRFPHY